MLLHTVGKRAVYTGGAAAFGTFYMEMGAVPACVSVGRASSGVVCKAHYASVKTKKLEAAVYGGF